jgi:ferredoxin
VKIFYKYYRLSKDCNGCGICEKTCPVSAIVMKDLPDHFQTSGQARQPLFSKKCEHCQGCVNMCPLRAIQFGRVKFGTPGYRHPKININDLAR